MGGFLVYDKGIMTGIKVDHDSEHAKDVAGHSSE